MKQSPGTLNSVDWGMPLAIDSRAIISTRHSPKQRNPRVALSYCRINSERNTKKAQPTGASAFCRHANRNRKFG